jgi:hypothetical protein
MRSVRDFGVACKLHDMGVRSGKGDQMAKRESLGNGKMYRFYKDGNPNLIVTAHGGKRTDTIERPEGLIWFCGRHGKSTATDADDIVTALKSNGDAARLRKIKDAGLHPYPVGALNNYDLEKFAGSHGGEEYENYDEYDKMAELGFDIVSPRNRWLSKGITLADVLNNKSIKNAKYKNIYCSFCRS